MKTVISSTMILLMILSIFSGLVPLVKAEPDSFFVWNTNPIPLPAPTLAHASITYNNRIYIIGGTVASVGTVGDVYFAGLSQDGSIASWTATASLPEPRYFTAVTTWNNFIYVVAGHIGSGPSPGERNTVWYARINSDGTLGNWMTTTPLPWASRNHFALVWNSRIYVGGGTDGYGWKDRVVYAEINDDGSLGNWVDTTSLPLAYGAMGALVKNGIIYLIGGTSTWGGPGLSHNEVYYASINPDGSVGSWSATTSLPDRRELHGTVLVGEDIYVTGGCKTPEGTIYDTVYRTTINIDGTLGGWTELERLLEPRDQHSSVALGGRIYVIGGWYNEIKDTIYYGIVTPPVAPDFEMSATPSSQKIILGEETTYTISIISINGFSSAVSLSALAVPSSDDISFSFAPTSLTPPPNGLAESMLTVSTKRKVTPNIYTIIIRGSSGEKLHSTTVILTIAWNELFYEIDYMPGHRPTDSVLAYIKNYYLIEGIIITFYVDDEVPLDPIVTIEEFWVYEATYNDLGDDKIIDGNKVFFSKWKWVLYGAVDAGGSNGYCDIPGNRLIATKAGNYIFIADESNDNLASAWSGLGVTSEEVEIVVLMHEMGHSIGILQLKWKWKDTGWEEVYDNDDTSVMAMLSPINCNSVPIYYSKAYWNKRDMEFYEI